LPSVRSLPSPGAPGGPRQSSYPPESFPPPASPTAGNYQASGQFPQQLRLQRTISAPSATTQLPGNSCNHAFSFQMNGMGTIIFYTACFR
jgi:hypothetical protein